MADRADGEANSSQESQIADSRRGGAQARNIHNRPGKCSCGFEIKPGQQIFWYPNDRTAICQKCGRTAELEVTDDDLNKIIHAM